MFFVRISNLKIIDFNLSIELDFLIDCKEKLIERKTKMIEKNRNQLEMKIEKIQQLNELNNKVKYCLEETCGNELNQFEIKKENFEKQVWIMINFFEKNWKKKFSFHKNIE